VTKRGLAVLAVVGAVGFMSIAAVVTTAAVQGRFGNDQRPTISSCGPNHPTGTVVQVTLSDRGEGMMGGANTMMVSLDAVPSVVASGSITFVATNTGALNHELVVLRAPSDGVGTRPVGSDGKIDEASSLGEASRSCASGAGNGISPGARSWVTRTLAPGRYELVCDEPWHYANGMFQMFIVR
jgi:uncharacterized cupredoxin-like copper-binding protein